jgi:hypothetical protein
LLQIDKIIIILQKMSKAVVVEWMDGWMGRETIWKTKSEISKPGFSLTRI